MKTLLYLFIVSFCMYVSPLQGQEPKMQWLKGYNGNSAVVRWVSRQADGGVVVNIEATDTGLDNACTITGNTDVFYKFSADAATLQWMKCYRGNFGDSAFTCMLETTGGNLVLGALSLGSINHQFLLHKETPSGTIIWRKTYGDGAEALLDDVMPAANGDYVLTGRTFFTDTNFTVHHGIFDNSDLAILRVDSNGNKLWSKVIGGTYDDRPASIVPAPGNGCYITGTTFSSDIDFAGINHGDVDCFVVRLDAAGNIVWKRCYGGSAGDNMGYAVANGRGGLIIAGHYESGDGDRTHYPAYGCPVWIAEIDSSGNITWDNCYGGGTGGNCYPNSVCKATDGSIWMAGVSTNAGAQVDAQYGRDDAWFLHIDSVGNFINSRVLGSSMWDRGTMIYPLLNGNVIAGGFYDTLNGTFASLNTHSNWPYSSAFLTVFSPETDAVADVNMHSSEIKVYPNPAGNELTIEAVHNISTIQVTNVLGQVVYNTTGSSVKERLNISSLPQGVYVVLVDGLWPVKFVKQ